MTKMVGGDALVAKHHHRGVVTCAGVGIFCRDNYETNLGMQAGTLLYNWEVRLPLSKP